MEKSRSNSFFASTTYGGIFLLLLIFLFLNSIARSTLSAASIDLTEEGLYSLSDGTKNIIDSLEEDITLNFYYSRTDSTAYPALQLYGNRVKDLLEEYRRYSSGKIKVNFNDPRPDSELEEWAQKYGLNPVQLPTGDRLYFGLVGLNETGGEQIIPMLDLGRQEFLEYDITKLIYSLTRSTKPTIGLISSIDIKGAEIPQNPYQQVSPGSQPWIFVEQLGSVVDLKHLEITVDKIDSAIDVLVVVHPKNLSEETRYAIDQYVLAGGKLVTFVDTFAQADTSNSPDPSSGQLPENTSSLNGLTEKWGIKLLEDKMVADIDRSTKINAGGGRPQDFVMWLSLTNQDFDKDNVVTSALDSVLLAWAGTLQLPEVEGVTSKALMKTTKASALKSRRVLQTGEGSPDALLRSYIPGGTEQIVAAQAQGEFETNFPDGPPSSSSEKHLAKSEKPSTVVVIADVDMLNDRYSAVAQNIFGKRLVRTINDNLIFVQNLLENLAGSNDLISIRSRGKFSRPFTRVQELERQAQLRWKREETMLQAKLNAANSRLNQLQSSSKEGGQNLFSGGLMEEIKKFRDERLQAQRRLRQVRRGLRSDIEALGTRLFLLNTFAIPLFLIVFSVTLAVLRNRKS